MKRLIFGFITAIALQGLAACSITEGTPSAAGRINKTSAESRLSDYHWQTQSDWNASAPYPAKLTFRDQRLAISGLCNNISANYSIQGQKITIHQPASTMRMCSDPALMDYEQKMVTKLEQVNTWAISNTNNQAEPKLSLTFQDGSQWQLNGQQTHEAKYGQSVIVFLEIQPQRFACNNPLMTNKQCLKVRTLSYDSSGLKQGVGEWQLFYDTIEGYTHEAGIRNVLRVKRYTRTQVPADASRYVYVMDMMIESERMP